MRDQPAASPVTVAGRPRGTHPVGTVRRRTAGVGLALLLLVAALVEARSALLFRTVRPWSFPERIHFCGRDYNRGGAVPAVAAEDVVGATPLQQVTEGPLWQPVYRHPADARRRAALRVPCAMALYLPEGSGYRSYALSGGP